MAFLGTLRSSYRTARPDASPKPRRKPLLELAAVAIGRTAAKAATKTSALRGFVLTAAGLGLVDVGAFEARTVAGWIATGVSLLVLDWKLE
jgi:hypothetical protein